MDYLPSLIQIPTLCSVCSSRRILYWRYVCCSFTASQCRSFWYLWSCFLPICCDLRPFFSLLGSDGLYVIDFSHLLYRKHANKPSNGEYVRPGVQLEVRSPVQKFISHSLQCSLTTSVSVNSMASLYRPELGFPEHRSRFT